MCKVQKKWGNQKYYRVDSTHNVSQHVCSDFVSYHQNVDLLINFLGFEQLVIDFQRSKYSQLIFKYCAYPLQPSNALGRSSTKGSSSRSYQMPPPPPPPVHGASGGRTTGAYTLWSTGGHSSGSPSTNTVSLKREHKRKFNRSLCGVLLGISIVLVILGILGIIGIAVYLGGKIT